MLGYGHQSTTTPHGRVLCVAYAILGVPLNAILIGALGSVFSNQVFTHRITDQSKTDTNKSETHYKGDRLELNNKFLNAFAQAFLALIGYFRSPG